MNLKQIIKYNTKTMKKLLLTLVTAFTILFAQAQVQCQANFSYTQSGIYTGFTDLSTINTFGSSLSYSVTWEWDFGDGTISTQQNPVHTYANNGIYTPCLTVFYFDSLMFNSCVSVSCDTLLIGNSIPASWDCNPTTGCYDPGTGLGQYNSFASCDTMCGNIVTPSWDCNPNMLGCSDPGTGNGQYPSLATCQAICGTPTPSWDCGITGCYDPGTGIGQYTTLSACQSVCVSTVSNLCDSMTLFSTGGSPQTILMAEVLNINTIIASWITTAPDGTVLGIDSMSNSHQIFNNMNNGQPYDTINVCITYADATGYSTCCVTWIWDANLWISNVSVTSIGDIGKSDKKILKVVDISGRESGKSKNQPLFYIYDDGTVEQRIVLE